MSIVDWSHYGNCFVRSGARQREKGIKIKIKFTHWIVRTIHLEKCWRCKRLLISTTSHTTTKYSNTITTTTTTAATKATKFNIINLQKYHRITMSTNMQIMNLKLLIKVCAWHIHHTLNASIEIQSLGLKLSIWLTYLFFVCFLWVCVCAYAAVYTRYTYISSTYHMIKKNAWNHRSMDI